MDYRIFNVRVWSFCMSITYKGDLRLVMMWGLLSSDVELTY